MHISTNNTIIACIISKYTVKYLFSTRTDQEFYSDRLEVLSEICLKYIKNPSKDFSNYNERKSNFYSKIVLFLLNQVLIHFNANIPKINIIIDNLLEYINLNRPIVINIVK